MVASLTLSAYLKLVTFYNNLKDKSPAIVFEHMEELLENANNSSLCRHEKTMEQRGVGTVGERV